jgi:hypothetical protein
VIKTEQVFNWISTTLSDEPPAEDATPLLDFDQSSAQWTRSGEADHTKDVRRLLLPRYQNMVIEQCELK